MIEQQNVFLKSASITVQKLKLFHEKYRKFSKKTQHVLQIIDSNI